MSRSTSHVASALTLALVTFSCATNLSAKSRTGFIPTSFRGWWATDRDGCKAEYWDDDSIIFISTSKLEFYEEAAEITRVRAQSPYSISASGHFSSEGANWSETDRLRLSKTLNQLTLVSSGKTATYVRCPAGTNPK